MKRSIWLISLVISLGILIPACRKEITEQPVSEMSATLPSSTNCRSLAFNVFLPETHYWKTLMQKWYDSDGKVRYLKAYISGEDGFAAKNNHFTEFEVNLDWGEITRTGNQIYLRDAVNNKLMMRVTMDPEGRAVASYLYNDLAPAPYFRIDTSYFYYTGNRLDFIYMTGERKLGSAPYPYWDMFQLVYDMYGNIRQVKGRGDSRINFVYDYSRPVNGSEQTVQFITPLRMLGYMELLKLPMNHLLQEVVVGAYIPGSIYTDEIFPIRIYNYDGHLLTPDNLVYSFSDLETITPNVFYTGWQCGPIPIPDAVNRNTGIENLEKFMKMFPAPAGR